jgi:hypothetical protein
MITNLAKEQYDVADIIANHCEEDSGEDVGFQVLFINELPRLQAKFPGIDEELLRYMFHEEIDGELIDCFIAPTKDARGKPFYGPTKLPKRANFGDPKNIHPESQGMFSEADSDD